MTKKENKKEKLEKIIEEITDNKNYHIEYKPFKGYRILWGGGTKYTSYKTFDDMEFTIKYNFTF